MRPLAPVVIVPEFFAGALSVEETQFGVRARRLPQWALDQAADPQFTMVEAQPSGVRLVLSTSASQVEFDVMPVRRNFKGTPVRPLGIYDIYVDGQLLTQTSASNASEILIDMATGESTFVLGEPATLVLSDLPTGAKTIEVYLPHNEETHLVALRADAAVEPVELPSVKRWVHHGSSISHGSNALAPSKIWPVIAARATGLELTNLGFGGSALMDPFVARVLRDTTADFISIKVGINLANSDLMRRRALRTALHGYIDTIRDGHPTTPLLLISPIYCRIHEDTPGPGAFDMDALASGRVAFKATGDPSEVPAGRLTLQTIREEVKSVVESRAKQDPNLHFLDGLELYGESDYAEYPLADELHPGAETHESMGMRFAQGFLSTLTL